MTSNLDILIPHIIPFLMVMFRLTGIFLFAPLFGSNVIPMRAKALLALTLSFCIYPLTPATPYLELTLGTMALAVASELLIGAIIGYGANIPLVAVQLGGLVMGQQLGLGLARVFNPDLNEDTDVLGQLLFLTALAIFLAFNGHHVLLAVLVGSFHTIQIGGYMPDANLIQLLIGLMQSMFELAIKVAAPLLCLVFLETIAMGFIAKTVPQLNILSLGFPLRIIVGLFLMISLMYPMYDEVTASMRVALKQIEALMIGP